MKNHSIKSKVNFTLWIVIIIEILVAVIFYSFLPKEIPMQWNNSYVNWYADKMLIFIYPIVSTAIVLLLKPVIIARFSTPMLSNTVMLSLIFILLSCEIYTIAYCLGFQ